MTDQLSVVNEALVRLGVPPIASLSGPEAQSLALSTLYQTTIEELISDFPWSFAVREATLSELSIDPLDLRVGGYQYVYQLPNDLLRVVGLRSYDRYRLSGDQLFANDREARLVYIAEAPEQTWPPYFRQAAVMSLAAAAAISITDSSNRADLFYREAQRMRARARSLDSQQAPAEVFNLMRVYAERSPNPLAG